MSNTATNVSAGKPKVGGAIYRAPLSDSLVLPTDAVTDLPAVFVLLGYASDDGLVNTNSPESETIKAWGGDPVLNILKEKTDEFKIKLIEVLNKDVLQTVYGRDNVTGDLATGMTVKANSSEPEEFAWVFELVMRGGVLKRIVLPDAKMSELDDIEYTDEDAVGYAMTLLAMADSDGQTHYEYLQAPSKSASDNSDMNDGK